MSKVWISRAANNHPQKVVTYDLILQERSCRT
jgi:hypothetical protein